MNDTVGIVIVSHSKDIAKGTADMVRQMVGAEVRVAFCGGNADGGLGTNVPSIIEAIDSAWSSKGVAVLVDLTYFDRPVFTICTARILNHRIFSH